MLEALSRAAFDADVARLDPSVPKRLGWTLVTAVYPILDVIFEHACTPLRLRLDCTDWDEVAPRILLLNSDGSDVTSAPPNAGGVFHPGRHPTTGKFFVCMRGAREYHTHPSHLSEHWENYRGRAGNDLFGIVAQLWRAWKKAVG